MYSHMSTVIAGVFSLLNRMLSWRSVWNDVYATERAVLAVRQEVKFSAKFATLRASGSAHVRQWRGFLTCRQAGVMKRITNACEARA
jgi:hypothetical protein